MNKLSPNNKQSLEKCRMPKIRRRPFYEKMILRFYDVTRKIKLWQLRIIYLYAIRIRSRRSSSRFICSIVLSFWFKRSSFCLSWCSFSSRARWARMNLALSICTKCVRSLFLSFWWPSSNSSSVIRFNDIWFFCTSRWGELESLNDFWSLWRHDAS